MSATEVPTYEHEQAETSLDRLAAEIVRQQDAKHDMIVSTQRIGWTTDYDGHTRVTVDGAEEMAPQSDITDRGEILTGWVVNDHAHGQVATAMEIPKRYYDRMRKAEAHHRLFDANVRHWLTAEPKRRMLRTLDGKIRAYVSNGYQRRDNYDLMEHLLPVFAEVPGWTFHVASLTDTNLYLRIVVPGIQRAIRVGDVVQCGVEIKNSEVGAGSLTVSPFVWRLVCRNGMVMPMAVSHRHVGRRVTEDDLNATFYSDATRQLDDAAFFAKVGDVVRGTLTEARFDQIVAPLMEAAGSEKMADPPSAVEHLAKTFDIHEGDKTSILLHLTLGGDLSQWGLANAVTAAAKSADSFDRVAEMESIGGRIVALPQDGWKAIARA